MPKDPNIQHLAVGVQPTKDGVIYLIPGTEGGRKYAGKIDKDTKDRIEFTVFLDPDDKNKTDKITFEYLTLSRFLEMQDHIFGFDALYPHFKTTDDVQRYYQTTFLHDYWRDLYEKNNK